MKTTKYPGPNEEVLEAQARVCTGPHQSRPLGKREGDPNPERILELILLSAREDLPWEARVSWPQMGAFFAAMTIRKGFKTETTWSAAETAAMEAYGSELERCLPTEVSFLMHPEKGYTASNEDEAATCSALQDVLAGSHLDYERTVRCLRSVLEDRVPDAWKAALLIGQRMNLESYEEVVGYVDAAAPSEPFEVQVESLTHFGQPFDGSTRYLRPTLFVAAVRAAIGRSSVLYGVDQMPPKQGVTEEQVLRELGANVNLSIGQGAEMIEDPDVGFSYLSQRAYCPGAYALRELRVHIKKRPPWATTEKVQQAYRSPDGDQMVVGFTHSGYEDTLLRFMWDRGMRAGLVVKGEEGSSHYSLRLGKPSSSERKAVNFSQGFRRVDGQRLEFSADVDPEEFDFKYPFNPRFEPMNAQAVALAGMAALDGKKGPIYDRLVLNAAVTDHWLGLCQDPQQAVADARSAIDSGGALRRLRNFIERSAAMKES